MSLDALYGEGAEQTWRDALGVMRPDVEVEVSFRPAPDGSVRFSASWEDGGWFKADCYPERIHWLSLQLPEGARNQGAYKRFCAALLPHLRAWGLDHFTAATDDDRPFGEAVFRHSGFESDGERLRVDLTGPNRMDEWTDAVDNAPA